MTNSKNFLIAGHESERLHYRRATPSDYDQWLPFFKDPKTSEHCHIEINDPSINCQNWYDTQFYRYDNNLGGLCAMIDKKNDQLIGHCGLMLQNIDHRDFLEIGYHILPKFWGQGFASEAVIFCRDYAFKRHCASELISIISMTNIASKKVAYKNGMIVDKTTTYANNRVNIYKITRDKWLKLNQQQPQKSHNEK